MIRFVLPSWPPSANNFLVNTGRGRALSPEARAWKTEAMWHMIAQRQSHSRKFGKELFDGKLAIAVRLYGPWRLKNGAVRRRDLSNTIKVLEDCAATVLAFDDRQVFELRASKIEAAEERCELDVWAEPPKGK